MMVLSKILMHFILKIQSNKLRKKFSINDQKLQEPYGNLLGPSDINFYPTDIQR
jgi:hypothetical protein